MDSWLHCEKPFFKGELRHFHLQNWQCETILGKSSINEYIKSIQILTLNTRRIKMCAHKKIIIKCTKTHSNVSQTQKRTLYWVLSHSISGVGAKHHAQGHNNQLMRNLKKSRFLPFLFCLLARYPLCFPKQHVSLVRKERQHYDSAVGRVHPISRNDVTDGSCTHTKPQDGGWFSFRCIAQLKGRAYSSKSMHM